MNILENVLIKYLKDTLGQLEEGTCELTDEQLKDAIHLFAHRPLSKEQACNFMHLSRSAFDTRMSKGQIPQGRKRTGFKELCWYQDELEEAKLNENERGI